MVLKSSFFNRSSLLVAPDLLGTRLVRKIGDDYISATIIEIEAYEGFDDLASHASRGRTPRNTPMFGAPGIIYVYFVYGMHWMLNLVCGPKDYPAAVLIRGVEDCLGPGRVTKKFLIDKNVNGEILAKKSGLWIEDALNAEEKEKRQIIMTPRIGVAYAGPIWSQKPYRFLLKQK
ncbi:MAG: DNA-3-methyladenine glycosylase [Candidatus Harrisonbacteria bacterium]|nr:DNA-3-methyladenine glycosylase [Candidatus Harrisonbacteria bacterium]